MIVKFGCKETEKIWEGKLSKKFPQNIQQTARRKLVHVNSAILINDLRVPPGNRLEKLRGDRKEEHSIRINKQWRITLSRPRLQRGCTRFMFLTFFKSHLR